MSSVLTNDDSIFTFLGMFLEILALWSHRNDRESSREKHNGAPAPAAESTV